ncbi:MAG: flagellin [Bryobacteraceae bacterium]
MAFSINTNGASLQAQYYLNQTHAFQGKTINQVTSGLRIVNSGDDAAGLAIANSLRDSQAVLTQGVRNINDAQAQLQTIDGGISNIGHLLDRLNTLATQSAASTFSGGAAGRATLQAEFASTMAEITRQATAMGMNNGGGMVAAPLSVVVGGGQTVAGGTVNVDLTGSAVDAVSLGLNSNTAAGTVALATDANVATAVGANAVATFTLTNTAAGGLADYGTAAGVVVTVGLGGVSTKAGLLTAINNAIAQQASANPDFAAANFSASINAAGHLVFSTTDPIANAPTVAGTDTGAQDLGFVVGGVAATAAGATDISTQGNAATAVATISAAVSALGAAQAGVGKNENILNYALNLASTQVTNEAASESQIRDADLAQQAANLTKAQILQQAGVAALAQANSAPQAVLALLKS